MKIFFALNSYCFSMLSCCVFLMSCKEDKSAKSILIKAPQKQQFLDYEVSDSNCKIKFFWKDNQGAILHNFSNLKKHVEIENKNLLFASNGGMYLTDYSPQGLYIEDGKIIKPLFDKKGDGNFSWLPNGIFYVTKANTSHVASTQEYTQLKKSETDMINYATQSGPMLVINGAMHPGFKSSSASYYVRNGVGILPNGKAVFVMSTKPLNFYDFAKHFIELGCQNALYLDGYVSRTYLPSKNFNKLDGDFGVMIGVVK
jgi:uncharacterized protein YigE (DUF2233 family)